MFDIQFLTEPSAAESASARPTAQVRDLPPGANGPVRVWLTSLLLCGASAWAWWTPLGEAVNVWSANPVYSHGFVVIPFAAWLLWQRRDALKTNAATPLSWGLLLVASGLALRWAGERYYVDWFASVALLPALLGVFVVAGGWGALHWAWPAVLVLVFMFPLPYRLETMLQGPLRQCGTAATVWVMQTAGLNAVAQGNVISLGEMRLGVEDACSGLSMLLTFFFLSTAVALVSERPLWERVVLLLSAIPIALIANIARMTAVGSLYEFGHPGAAEAVHDGAAFLMMPLALLMLWGEAAVLSGLVLDIDEQPVSMGLAEAGLIRGGN